MLVGSFVGYLMTLSIAEFI